MMDLTTFIGDMAGLAVLSVIWAAVLLKVLKLTSGQTLINLCALAFGWAIPEIWNTGVGYTFVSFIFPLLIYLIIWVLIKDKRTV